MSISITRYVDIQSGVGAGAGVAQRSLVLRVFSQNNLIPPDAIVTMTNADDVLTYFGSTSDEYAIAAKYFAFVSKTLGSPKSISFARWHPADIAPTLYGDTSAKTLANFTAVTAGHVKLNINGTSVDVGPIDLHAATTLAMVASDIQTALQANANPQLTAATVTLDTNNNRFILTGTVAGSGSITCSAATTNDIGALLGWSTAGAVPSVGAHSQAAQDAVSHSASNDDNFGSFAFGGAIVPIDSDVISVSTWNATQNVKFIFCVPVTASNAVAQQTAMKGNSGTCITLCSSLAEHAETMPAEILAATDYGRAGASANYMYYPFANRTATVTDNPSADTYDAIRVNYLGQTQSNGQKITFYQRGYLQGSASGQGAAPVALNVYAGEMWMKSSISADILNMFLNVPNIPANEIGRAQTLTIIQPTIDQSLANGVISAGKALTPSQKSYISQVTGNEAAWQQVQTKGYWIDAQIVEATNPINGLVEASAQYIIVYGKNDQVMSVTGNDILI